MSSQRFYPFYQIVRLDSRDHNPAGTGIPAEQSLVWAAAKPYKHASDKNSNTGGDRA
jgi:hypothetical protein